VSWRRSITSNQRIDVVLQRTFFLVQNQPDTFSLVTGSTGAYFVGIANNFFLTKRVQFNLMPGLYFSRLIYSQSQGRTFPTRSDSLTNEKLRSVYLQVPLGFSVLLMRNAGTGVSDVRLGAGLSPGLHLGSSSKYIIESDGVKTKAKRASSDPLAALSLSAYLRLSYKFVGITAAYRITPYFSRQPVPATGLVYPAVAPLEVGVFVQF
jgi:hypothetical protein